MNGYQFAHTQTYSLKGNKVNRSVKDVLGENSRQIGQANHVENVKPPVIRFGVDPMELLPIIEQRIADAKANLKGTGKRIQSNTHVMEGSVFSHPYTVDELRNDKDAQKKYVAWRNDMIKYAINDANSRGLETLSVVEHLDESHPHIHVLNIVKPSDDNPRLDAKNCHAGHRASKLSQANGDNPKQQMAEYRSAMKKWQDDIWENVSAKHGLTRIGPRKRRLTRSEWSKQKEGAQQLQQSIEYKQSIDNELKDVQQVRDENTLLKADVTNLQNDLNALRVEYSDLEQRSKAEYDDLRDRANAVIQEKDKLIEELTPTTPAFRPR
jgi:chaperonin cofactor prefoldin